MSSSVMKLCTNTTLMAFANTSTLQHIETVHWLFNGANQISVLCNVSYCVYVIEVSDHIRICNYGRDHNKCVSKTHIN